MGIMRAVALLFLCLLAVPTLLPAQATTLYSMGEPTDEEQLYLEMINRARANPTEEGLRMAASTHPDILIALEQYGVDLEMLKQEFAALPVRPPLAINAKLTTMARNHTQDMFDHALQQHEGSNGSTLAERVALVQYPAVVGGENVFSSVVDVEYGHAGFQIDWGAGPGGMQVGRGHRDNIHKDYREVGIGVVLGSNNVEGREVGPQLVTQNFGTQTASLAYVTGVAYYDLNSNGFYDVGEGIGGVTVNVAGSSFHTQTSASGGFAVPVPTTSTTRAVTFSGLGFNATTDAVITNGANVKVDLKPVYAAPVPAGNPTVAAGEGGTYTFQTVPGATGYEWQSLSLQATATDQADDLDKMDVRVSAGYQPLSTTVKHSGTGAYRFAHAASLYAAETLTYKDSFVVKAGAAVRFRSRLQYATVNQVARVQVSTDDGRHWSDIYAQPGSSPEDGPSNPGESSFSQRTASLAAYVGRQVRLRFNYEVLSGSFFPGAATSVGWSVDEVQFDHLSTVADSRLTEVATGQSSFTFVPPVTGDYALNLRPLISGRAWNFGPVALVQVLESPIDITVGIPASPAFTPGAGVLTFGSVTLQSQVTRTITLTNSGSEPLTDLSVDVEGTHETEFVATQPASSSLSPGSSQTVDITFTPLENGSRQAVLKIFSNDPDESPFIVNLSGQGTQDLGFLTSPAPLAVVLGAEAVFSAEANMEGATYQWKKNNANIKGATSRELRLAAVKASDAGLYRVEIKGGDPVATMLSEAVPLGVVENVEKTVVMREGKPATVKLAVKAYGPELGYEWKSSAAFESAGENTTKLTKTLVLPTLPGSTYAGTYYCEVTAGASSPAIGGTTHLFIYSSAPVVMEDQALPPAMVGGEFRHQIRVSEDPAAMPLSYGAKGLPPGLKVNAKTGEISGRPTKANSYEVTLTATNQAGTGQSKVTLVVDSYPTDLAGNYVGLVARHETLNQSLGGRLDLKVTTLGAFSGSLTLGTAKIALKGSLTLDASGVEPPMLEVEVQPPGKPLPGKIRLQASFNASGHLLTEAQITRGAEAAAISGWHQPYDGKLAVASPYLGLHSFGLKPLELAGNPHVPQGWGFGSFTPAKDGKVTVAGRTADGEKFTTASFVGPQGQVLLYQTLYTTPVKGSLHGILEVDAGSEAQPDDVSDNSVEGTLSWMRPENTLAKARTYVDGFGLPGTPIASPVLLNAAGAAYTPPAGEAVILELSPGTDNARLTLAQGGLEANLAVALSIGAKSKILAAAPESAPAAFKLAANVKTGLLTGGLTLADGRKVTLQGQLTKDENENPVGVGFFLLPELPDNGLPANATPILSGALEVGLAGGL